MTVQKIAEILADRKILIDTDRKSDSFFSRIENLSCDSRNIPPNTLFFAKGVNGNVVNAILGIKLHKNIPNMANGFLFVELVSAAHVGMPPFLYVKILYYM